MFALGIPLGSFWNFFGVICCHFGIILALVSFRGHLGVTLGSFWDHSSIWGSFRDHSGIISISFWDQFGICLRSFWDFVFAFGISLVSYWDHLSIWHHFRMIWVALWDQFGIIWGSLLYHFRFFWGPRAAGIWGRGSACCWNLGYPPSPPSPPSCFLGLFLATITFAPNAKGPVVFIWG